MAKSLVTKATTVLLCQKEKAKQIWRPVISGPIGDSEEIPIGASDVIKADAIRDSDESWDANLFNLAILAEIAGDTNLTRIQRFNPLARALNSNLLSANMISARDAYGSLGTKKFWVPKFKN